MLKVGFELDQLKFAFCYRIYLRWRTHRGKLQAALSNLDRDTVNLRVERYYVRCLECSADNKDVLTLLSLRPDHAVSVTASQVKGQVSKWLREAKGLDSPAKLLSRGYFACTTGDTTADAVDRYLDQQGQHHGYASRPRPPVFVRTFEPSQADLDRLQPKHASTVLQFHFVMAIRRRRGVFGQTSGEAITHRWRQLQDQEKMAVLKVSFVPDHVHVAVRVHPSVVPEYLFVVLMNTAQDVMWAEFDLDVIRAAVERLWQPSGYIGSYGDLNSSSISSYVSKWKESS